MKVLILCCMFLVALVPSIEGGEFSPVISIHLQLIEDLFRENGMHQARVALDRQGRVFLAGSYRDNHQVQAAFSLAQSVVGVKWTSPVMPEKVQVREWGEKLAQLFPTVAVDAPARSTVRIDSAVTKYALIVGIGTFRHDAQGKNRLKYAASDARNLHALVTGDARFAYRTDNVHLLLDDQATVAAILAGLNQIASVADANDEILVYFSSHGAPVYDGSLNIVTYDTSFKNRLAMAETSLEMKRVTRILQSLNVRKIVIILDVCYSGSAFKSLDGFYVAGAKNINFDDDNMGMSGETMARSILGAKDIVVEGGAARARQGWEGKQVVVFSASGAGERSWESDAIRGSFFTYHLVRSLHGGKPLGAAFVQARPLVSAGVQKEKHAEQNPQVATTVDSWVDVAL